MKFSSNVKEIVIQYIFVRKYPKPNNHPYKKKNFFLFFMTDLLNKKIKNMLNVKKLTIKKFNGGRLKELNAPREDIIKTSNINFLFNLIYTFLNRFKNFLFLILHFYVVIFFDMIKI